MPLSTRYCGHTSEENKTQYFTMPSLYFGVSEKTFEDIDSLQFVSTKTTSTFYVKASYFALMRRSGWSLLESWITLFHILLRRDTKRLTSTLSNISVFTYSWKDQCCFALLLLAPILFILLFTIFI